LEYKIPIRVEFTKTAYKALASIPAHILTKVKLWSAEVELHGIRASESSLVITTSLSRGNAMVSGQFASIMHIALSTLKPPKAMLK
jgi:hypothetical protein